jgi:hypothetical protein
MLGFETGYHGVVKMAHTLKQSEEWFKTQNGSISYRSGLAGSSRPCCCSSSRQTIAKAIIAAALLLVFAFRGASCQAHAQCRLLLQGNSDTNSSSTNTSSSANSNSSTARIGVAVASLSCNGSDGTPVPISVNTTYLQQHAAAFTGVKILVVSACKADAADASPAPIHGLLYFCSSSHHIMLLRPVIRNLQLPLALPSDISSANNSWHQAVLVFAGDVTATIVDGSFTDNVAGSVLVFKQQAMMSVTNSSFQRNDSTFGGELMPCRVSCVTAAC